jgi:hypothetical protein
MLHIFYNLYELNKEFYDTLLGCDNNIKITENQN